MKKEKSEKKDEIIRTYCLKDSANEIKLSAVSDVLDEYRVAAGRIASYHWLLFNWLGKEFKDFEDVKHIRTKLGERYKQTCQTQVVGMLKSYIANIQTRFIEMVFNSSISEGDRVKYFYINKYMFWQRNEITMRGEPIEWEIILNARKMFKHLTRNHPHTAHINMVLDQKVMTLHLKEENKAKKFDYWIEMSTLSKGNKTWIPLQTNEFFKKKDGVFKHSIQVNKKDGKITFSVVKSIKPELIEGAVKKLGFDVGLCCFIATEYGDHLGKKLMEYVRKYDNITTKLFKNLQAQGIKPGDNKRYKALIKKIKEYLKNEIGRLINKLVKRINPSEITVENLDFRGSNIGKKNNRLLHKFGKGILTKKLDNITQHKKIKLNKINPPYTSQECPVCSYTSKKNRKTQSKFECQYCGKKGHADTIGGKNVSGRSSPEFHKLNKEKIFDLLCEKHTAWKDAQRCHSTASGALADHREPHSPNLIHTECNI